MALAASVASLLAVGMFALVSAAFGHRLLRLALLQFHSETEHLLCAVGLGVICLNVLFFLAQISTRIRFCIFTVLAIALFVGMTEMRPVLKKIGRILSRTLSESMSDKAVATVVISVLFVEGLAAMAPISGSDALHYHFTAPELTLRFGFHPNFFLSTSFLCGQSHLLILAGLALGGVRLASGLIFLGGALTAAACGCLARRWTNNRWACVAALLFLLTPVVFWQISMAGAPDVWMAFFAVLGILIISSYGELPTRSHAVLAGVFAGAIAGAKYTGCFVAVSMAVAYLWEASSRRNVVAFTAGVLGSGVWPYARNLAWTGDPLFPILLKWISPDKINSYTLAAYLADTGAAKPKSLWQLIRFPLFAGIDPMHTGFWDYFGPVIFVTAPLLFLVIRNTPTWRAAMTVWILSALGIGISSGSTRYLLPILPISIATTLAGVAYLRILQWRVMYYMLMVTLGSFLTFGAASLLVYDRPALSVATGALSQEEYLRMRVPEYEEAEFINRTLSGSDTSGKTLVFMRHVFYLRVPFLYGDPAASWGIDPSILQTPEEWLALFHAQSIRWVVRSPNYPVAVAAPLFQLEASGKLLPIARTEVADFQGMKITGQRQIVPVTILRVNP
jgi:hypothetical protein